MSWTLGGGGFELFCNRDELRTRAVALAPAASARNGVAYLAPTDGEAGGTWIAVNEHGLALCLVNRYPALAGDGFVSRGRLVRELAGAPSAEEVARRLSRLESDSEPRYRPFTLLALETGFAPRVLAWDGRRVFAPSVDPVSPPIVSSSYDPAGVEAARRRLWEPVLGAGEATPDDLLELHRSHRPRRGPLSPCMHRDDARTVSLTRVRVTAAAVDLSYAGGPPCRTELSPPLTLNRHGV